MTRPAPPGLAALALTSLALAGCTAPPPPLCGPPPAPPPAPLAWVVDYGWHTEIIVPAAQLRPPLDLVGAMFPAAHTLSFGFGKQSFMTLAAPGVLDLVAGVVPGPGTLRVIPLPADPGQLYRSPVVRLPLTEDQWHRLSAFLWRSFARTPAGALIPVPAEEQPGRFFAAAAGYSLAYTCNAWTVDALAQAGLPVGGVVVRSSGAMAEVATVTGACTDAR